MKTTKFYLITLLFLISCTSDSTSAINQFGLNIVGKWKLTEILAYDGTGTDGPHYVTDGYEFELFENGNFTSNEVTNYSGGKYSITADSIVTLKFKAHGLQDFIKKKKITSFMNQILDTSYDLTGTSCIEGCGERFNRITITGQ